jgi:hypothetical protein
VSNVTPNCLRSVRPYSIMITELGAGSMSAIGARGFREPSGEA